MQLLYSPLEAARMLGISRSSLYRLLAAGSLESVKVRSSRRISAEALDEFIDRLRDEDRLAFDADVAETRAG